MTAAEQRFSEVFDYFEFTTAGSDIPRGEAELMKIAQDLTEYDHLPLAAKAFQFLLATFSQQRKIHDLLKTTTIVVDEETKGVVEEVHKLCDTFRLKNRYGMKVSDATDILNICRKLVQIGNNEGS
jgi:hypothetical protein